MSDARNKIEEFLESEGISNLTEVKEKLGFENGTIQHHIHSSDVIEKKNGVFVYKEYCSSCALKVICSDRCVLRFLEKDKYRQVLKSLNNGKTQVEIAEDLNLDKSTVSYYISNLEQLGAIGENKKPIEPVKNIISV